MTIVSQTLETVVIDSVRPHPENPRRGNVGLIRESIDNNGFVGGIIVQRSTGHILAGSHRWKAARESGLTEIPVLWVDVDDAHARRILLADNKTSDTSTYDDSELLEILQAIMDDEGTLEGTLFTEDDLDDVLASLQEEDVPGTTPKRSRSSSGSSRSSSRKTDDDESGQTEPEESSFEILVKLESKADQEALLEKLEADGFQCKLLTS